MQLPLKRGRKDVADPVAKTGACSSLGSAGKTPATSAIPSGLSHLEGQHSGAHTHTHTNQALHAEHGYDLRKNSAILAQYLFGIFVVCLRYPLLDHIFWARDNLIKCELQKASKGKQPNTSPTSNYSTVFDGIFRAELQQKYARIISIESIIKLKSFI